MSEMGKNGVIFVQFLANLTLMAHISGARTCPANIFGARRKAHRGLAHRKEAHGILPIRLNAHEDTCTLGYLHIRIVAQKPHAHQKLEP